jgi:proton-translocating NADH-quinone oxidoreductase chain M
VSPVNILIILLYIAITNQWVFGFWFFYAAIVLIPYMFCDCVGGINRLIITAANFLVGDEIIFFLPVILLLILILLSLYPPFFTNLNLGSLKSFSFFIYFYIFLHYLIIFCYYARSTGINYFLYKTFYISRAFNFNISFGIDNYTIFFLLLTSLLFPFCILINWNYGLVDFKKFLILISLLDISLVCAFLSTNLFFFYFFFEITLIPMYIIINLWGSRTRKVHAGFYFFIYTVFGSIFLLLGILLLYSMFKTTDIRVLSNSYISYERQILLWILFFIGFSTKIPLPPFHLWLPEAHVEAPTSGSVILAGILLKLGSYGMLRFILPVYYYANYFFLPFVYGICCVSIIYISCIAIRQTDLKKIIAYSSIAHMSFVVMGLFSCNLEGLQGSVFLMISHGVVSAALFLCICIL